MQKIKKANMVCDLHPAVLSEADQKLLSHVEMCYSVALALTRDPVLGQRLARATLLWAWQRQATGGGLGGGDVKMALLRELRGRFLRDYYPVCARDVRQVGPVGFSGTSEEAFCAAGSTSHAEIGAVG